MTDKELLEYVQITIKLLNALSVNAKRNSKYYTASQILLAKCCLEDTIDTLTWITEDANDSK